jgi:hypothetical protein
MATSEQFQGCNERGHKETEHGVYTANMSKLIRVGKMLAIPRNQKVAFVIRGQRQVQRIAGRIGRHDFVLYVRLHYFDDRRLDGQDRQASDKSQPVCRSAPAVRRPIRPAPPDS